MIKRCLTSVLIGMASVALLNAAPSDTLKPGEWYEVPNSQLRAVLPRPIPPGNTGPRALMGAWSGGAYDTKRERLIIWGGGHADYAGNELYVFDLSSLSWSRIWGPSAEIPPIGAPEEAYPDGNPAARHTYDGLEYIPGIDRFWAQGGALYSGSGGAKNDTWTFDFEKRVWERKAKSLEDRGSIVSSAYDPVTQHIFVQRYTLFMEYNPMTDIWTKRGAYDLGFSAQGVGVMDPKRRKFLIIGGGMVWAYDLKQAGRLQLQRLHTTGDTTIVQTRYPGVEYDPITDKIVGWNGGADVYTLDVDTLIWTKHLPAPTNTVIPGSAASAGTFGRFRYIPSKNVFITVSSIDQNVYIYKFSSGKETQSFQHKP